MTGEQPYQPIDCSLHDRVEDLATRRRRVVLRYLTDGGEVQTEDTIADWFARDGVEFIRTGSGTTIRMDLVVEVDGVRYR